MNAIARAARDWAKHGLIPMAARDKRPLAKDWQILDPAEHLARIEADPPEQIGLRMGTQPRSGRSLVAIDIDTGKGGEESLQALVAELGPLPDTLAQRTGGGGWHYILEWPSAVAGQGPPNTVGKLGPGIDTRGDHGHVVIAPSPHASGRRYEIVDHRPPAVLPDAWTRRIIGAVPCRLKPPASEPDHGRPESSSGLLDRVRRYIAVMPTAIAGSGGHTATWRVAQVLVRGFRLERADAERLMAEYNARCEPPWNAREVAHKLDDAETKSRLPFGYLLERGSETWNSCAWRAEWDEGYIRRGVIGTPPAAEGSHGTARPRIGLKLAPDKGHRELADVVDDAARVLGERAGDVYCRDGQLVDVGPVDVYVGRDGRQRRTAASIGIRPMPVSEVQRQLSRCAVWFTSRHSRHHGAWLEAETDPPQWLAVAVANMRRWPTVRPISGVLTAPSIRPDGTIIQAAGWDEVTGFLYAPDRQYPAVPLAPTQGDARQALAALRGVFSTPSDDFDGFPFALPAEQDVPIANLLTLIARPAIDGCVPAYVYDASTPGSGKGLLADAVCVIATGIDMPKGIYTDNQDELAKHLGALVLAGVAVAGLDNIDQRMALCGGVLDAVLTARRPQLRILGRSEAPAVDWHAVVMATGNNVQITGDTQRRCIVCRLEPSVERPELRTRYRVSDLLAYVRENRGALVHAALTILRAYYSAGRPDVGLTPLGSYEAWSRVVASALVYAGGHDVTRCVANQNRSIDDPDLEAATALLAAIDRVREPVSAGALIRMGYGTDGGANDESLSRHGADIREALDVLAPRRGRDGKPSPKSVGCVLKRFRGRVLGGLRLLSRQSPKGGASVEWYVAPADGSGAAGATGASSSRFPEKVTGRENHRGERNPPKAPKAPKQGFDPGILGAQA